MQYDLEIYTSAESLLEGAGSDLGVVAKTRGFPSAVSRGLASTKYYSFLQEISLDCPESHPPRLILGGVGDNKHYSMVIARYLGPDYTGRTTPTIHSATLLKDQLIQSELSPAHFLRSVAERLTCWCGPPSFIDPKPEIATKKRRLDFMVSSVWSRNLQGDTLRHFFAFFVDSIISSKQTGKAVIFVLPAADACDGINLLLNLLSLLPSSIQFEQTIATHILVNADFPRGGTIGFTYPKTEFLVQALARHDSRKPVVINLQQNVGLGTPVSLTFGVMVGEAFCNQDEGTLDRLVTLWDSGGFSSTTSKVFPTYFQTTLQLEDSARGECTLKAVQSIGIMLDDLKDVPLQAQKHIDAICDRWIANIASKSSVTSLECLIAVVSTNSMPIQAQRNALTHLLRMYSNVLAYLLNLEENKRSTQIVDKLIASMVSDAPRFARQTIEFLSKNPDFALGLEITNSLLSSPHISSSQLLEWLTKIRSKANLQKVSQLLERKLGERLSVTDVASIIESSGLEIPRTIIQLWNIGHQSTDQSTRQLCDTILRFSFSQPTPNCLQALAPLLRQQLESTSKDRLRSNLLLLSKNSPHQVWLHQNLGDLVAPPKSSESSMIRIDPFASQTYQETRSLTSSRKKPVADLWRRSTAPGAWMTAVTAGVLYASAIGLQESSIFGLIYHPMRSSIFFGSILFAALTVFSSRWLDRNPNSTAIPNSLLQNLVFLCSISLIFASALFMLDKFQLLRLEDVRFSWLRQIFSFLAYGSITHTI